ncbi:MAG: class I SAM-dependent methyltransferase [Alphaproteobacteria bacterium]
MTLTFWDERFAGDGYRYGEVPNPFVASQAGRLPRGGAVLSIGDGEGRNGVWLAEQGFVTTSQDGSEIAQGKATRMAAERSVPLTTVLSDLTAWDWPQSAFDGAVCVFVHFRPVQRAMVHRALLEAVKPGGLVIMEVFHRDQLALKTGGPPELEMLYSAAMLREDFAAADILLLEETRSFVPQDSFQRGEAALVRLIARRR